MHSKKELIIKILFGTYLVVLVYLLFGGHRGAWSNMSMVEYALMQMNLVPFKTITGYINAISTGSMNLSIPLANLFGNLLMFLPMGIFIPLYVPKTRNLKWYVVFMSGMILMIELVQFVTKRGSFDVDDFILNFVGIMIGYALWNTTIVQKIIGNNQNK